MNMREPLALMDVESKMLELIALLERATHSQRQRWEADGQADAEYDIAFGQAFLLAKEGALPGQSKGDSDMTAKQRATVVCADKLRERNATHALLESAREAARNYRTAIEALRSLNANARALTVEGA